MRVKIKSLAKHRKQKNSTYSGAGYAPDYKRKRIKRRVRAKEFVEKYH